MNMHKRLLNLILTGCLLALAAGCGSGAIGGGSGGSAASNPSDPANLDGDAAPVTISFKAIAGSTAALTTTDSTGAAADITSASVTIERIDIKLPDGLNCATLGVPLPSFAVCDNSENDALDDNPETNPSDDLAGDNDKIRLNGPFVVDLLTGTSTPSLADLTLPSGMVREIKVKLSHLTVAGTVDVGGTPTPFNIDSSIDKDIEYSDLSGFEISEAVSVNEIILSFDVAKWLAGVDLAACAADCSEFDDMIEHNVEDSGSFSEDDHSGEDDGSGHDVGDDNGVDDPSTHDIGDDNGVDDPSGHDVGDDSAA